MNIRLSASGFDMTGELQKYANAKIALLAKRVPRGQRKDIACDVHFSQKVRKGAKFNTCGFSFTLGDTRFRSEETTQHMYAALDIAVVHVERQLADHLAKQPKRPLRTRLRRAADNQ